MQGVLGENATTVAAHGHSEHDLLALASPVFDLILRVNAGLITPSIEMRQAVDRSLKQMEQQRAATGLTEAQVQAAKFALAAFVDETVLTANFPLRDEWEKYPLQLKHFGEHLAGVKFFERLDELLRRPAENGAVLEIYYVCLLLGFKGKYKLYYEDQLRAVIQQVAEQLRRLNRLRTIGLSPHGRVDDQPGPPVAPGLPRWMKVGGGAMLASVFLLYLVLFFALDRILYSAKEQLLR